MRNVILASLLLASTSTLMADCESFTSYTKSKSSINIVKSTVLFSGEYADYTKQMGEINSKYATGAAGGALAGATSQVPTLMNNLSGAAAGLGIGVAAGLLDPVIWGMLADQQFIRVEKMEDSKGNFTLRRTLLVCDKNPSISVSQANSKMQGGN